MHQKREQPCLSHQRFEIDFPGQIQNRQVSLLTPRVIVITQHVAFDENIEQVRTMADDSFPILVAECGKGADILFGRGLEHGLDIIEMGCQAPVLVGLLRFVDLRSLSASAKPQQGTPPVLDEKATIGRFRSYSTSERIDELTAHHFELERISVHISNDREPLRVRETLASIEPDQQVPALAFVVELLDEVPTELLIRRRITREVRTDLVIGRHPGLLTPGSGIGGQRNINRAKLPGGIGIFGVSLQHDKMNRHANDRLVSRLAEGTAEANLVILPRRAVDADNNVADLETRLFSRRSHRNPDDLDAEL